MSDVNIYDIRRKFTSEEFAPESRVEVKDQTCPHCAEPLGHRKLSKVGDSDGFEVVHKTCADSYLESLVNVAHAKAEAEAQAERERQQAEREQRRHRRGVLVDYLEEKPQWGDEDEVRFWRVVYSAHRKIEMAKKDIDEFAQKLVDSQNPLHELEWSRGVFKAAAEKLVAERYVMNVFEAGGTLADLEHHVRRELLVKANGLNSQSTSPTSNYADQCEIAAMAGLMKSVVGDWLGGW